MSNACRLVSLAVLAVLAPFALSAEDGADKVKTLLLARLQHDGVSPGYNVARRAVVCSGIASARYDAAADKDRLASLRQVVYTEATMKAKSALAGFVRQNRSAWETVIDRAEDGKSVWRSAAGSVLKSQKVLRGCLIRDSVELQDEGLLHVAVAVEWGESLERDVRDVVSGAVELKQEDIDVVRTWLENKGPLLCIGGRFCRLADGFNFPVAVAAVDVEGTNALRLDAATKFVERMASSAFDGIFNTALRVDAKEESSVQISESAGKRSLVASDFAEQSILAVAGGDKIIRRQVVFEDVVRDPKTGRRCYVIAYGPRVGRKLR